MACIEHHGETKPTLTARVTYDLVKTEKFCRADGKLRLRIRVEQVRELWATKRLISPCIGDFMSLALLRLRLRLRLCRELYLNVVAAHI